MPLRLPRCRTVSWPTTLSRRHLAAQPEPLYVVLLLIVLEAVIQIQLSNTVYSRLFSFHEDGTERPEGDGEGVITSALRVLCPVSDVHTPFIRVPPLPSICAREKEM